MTRRISPAGAIATIAAVLVVIGGLLVVGSPSHARERRLDELRTEDLSTLSQSIDAYWIKHAMLPDSLDSLVSTHLLDRIPKDPETNSRYTYMASGERSYRLCATFTQPSDTSDAVHGAAVMVAGIHSWRHGAGESCFDLTPPKKETQ
jgi:hypothetical protein